MPEPSFEDPPNPDQVRELSDDQALQRLDAFITSVPPTGGYRHEIYLANHRVMSSLRRYVLKGRRGGDFMWALMSNNFVAVVGRADDDVRKVLPDLANYLWNRCPSTCWGSQEEANAWVKKGGWLGDHSPQDTLIYARAQQL